MKAARFVGPEKIELVELPDPTPGEGEVLVRVVYSGVCGSDRRLWEEGQKGDEVQGHEPAGVVEAVGPGVRRVKPGDEVAVHNVVGCGQCDYCASGSYVYCADKRGAVNGGYGELLVAPERNLVPLPRWFGLDRGCLLVDLLGTPFRAVKRAGVAEGQTVVVFGAGPVGAMTVQCAAARGARVISVEPIAYRREVALAQGAETALDPEQGDVAQAVRELTRGGADVALECSGNPQAELAALRCVRPEGRVVFVGENHEPLPLVPSRDFIRRGTQVLGSWYSHLGDVPEMIRLVERGKLDPLRLVTHRVEIEDIAQGFAAFFSRAEGCVKVIVHFPH